MAVEKRFFCNMCGCRLGESNGPEDAMPGWGLRSDDTRPGWYKSSLDGAAIHVCAVCGPAIAAVFVPNSLPMHPHLANALERARDWASSDRLNTENARHEAVRLLLDIAKASK